MTPWKALLPLRVVALMIAAARPAVFSGVVIRLHLEFGEGIWRWNHGLIAIALVGFLVGVVVDPVKLEVVIHRGKAVDVIGSVTRRIGRDRCDQ